MRFRKLQIAWSVGWGLLAVLLIALWVRSYWRAELASRLTNDSALTLGSDHGIVYFVHRNLTSTPTAPLGWNYAPIEVTAPAKYLELKSLPNLVMGCVPHLALVGFGIAVAAAPWLLKRYSLRTLLVATTLLAAALGLAVWAVKE